MVKKRGLKSLTPSELEFSINDSISKDDTYTFFSYFLKSQKVYACSIVNVNPWNTNINKTSHKCLSQSNSLPQKQKFFKMLNSLNLYVIKKWYIVQILYIIIWKSIWSFFWQENECFKITKPYKWVFFSRWLD